MFAFLVPILAVVACTSDSTPSASSLDSLPSASDSVEPSIPGPESADPSVDSSVGAADDVDACALLPEEELSAIIDGEAETTRMPVSAWIVGQCAWSGPTASFFLGLGTAGSLRAHDPEVADAEAKLAAYKLERTGEDVPDVGDGAVISSGGIALYKGDVYVEITKIRLTDDQLVAIAQLAAAEL